MANSTISYLWRDKDAPKGFQGRCFAAQPHQPIARDPGFPGQLRQPVSGDAPLALPAGAAGRADSRRAHRLRRQLLDAAHDSQAGLRSRNPADRKARPRADGFHHRPRQHQGAHASAHRAQRAANSGFRRVERALRRLQSFHLGVHNLPSARAAEWMATFEDFTAHPSDARLTEILAALHQEPNVLVVFNHPMWDLYLIGKEKHQFLVNEFLQKNGAYLHALELNGLRNWDENRAVRRLAEKWNMLLIAGGDRHGVEPNANINLTNATSFTEFVHEIRRQKKSNVLFMPQYAEPWKHRILQSTVDAIRHYPEFPQGSRTWDERVYHPDPNGVVRPLSELWPGGSAPRVMTVIITMVQMMGRGLVSGGLRMAGANRTSCAWPSASRTASGRKPATLIRKQTVASAPIVVCVPRAHFPSGCPNWLCIHSLAGLLACPFALDESFRATRRLFP